MISAVVGLALVVIFELCSRFICTKFAQINEWAPCPVARQIDSAAPANTSLRPDRQEGFGTASAYHSSQSVFRAVDMTCRAEKLSYDPTIQGASVSDQYVRSDVVAIVKFSWCNFATFTHVDKPSVEDISFRLIQSECHKSQAR